MRCEGCWLHQLAALTPPSRLSLVTPALDASGSPLCPARSHCWLLTVQRAQRQRPCPPQNSSSPRTSSTSLVCCTPTYHSPVISAYSLSCASSSPRLHPCRLLPSVEHRQETAVLTRHTALLARHSTSARLPSVVCLVQHRPPSCTTASSWRTRSSTSTAGKQEASYCTDARCAVVLPGSAFAASSLSHGQGERRARTSSHPAADVQ